MNSETRLQLAIYDITQKSYIGSILQCMRIYKDKKCPTAGVFFDKKLRTISMIYNPDFVDKLTDPELKGLLYHELEHIMRNHILLYNKEIHRKEHKRFNIAMDLVINQSIPTTFKKNKKGNDTTELSVTLPKGGVFLHEFKDKNGKPFPEKESTEVYYDLLDGATYEKKPEDGGQPGEGPATLDEHFWDGAEEKDLLEGTSDLLKRAQNHYEKSHMAKSKELMDALDQLHKTLTNINYKHILESSLRSSLPGKDISKTWSRPSRRYNLAAKGNKIKPNPSVAVYQDTSGSMSYTEINENINLMNDIFKHGVRELTCSLFHHNVYKTKVYKKNQPFEKNEVQGGGTDLTDVMNGIDKKGADVNIIITDGYYDRPLIPKGMKNKTVFFLIKEGGNVEHCLKDIGKTLVFKVIK